jgi:hypothetical protein
MPAEICFPHKQTLLQFVLSWLIYGLITGAVPSPGKEGLLVDEAITTITLICPGASMLFYRAALPLSAQPLSYVAGVIRRHRAKIGSCWRELNAGRPVHPGGEQFWKDGRHDIACPPRGVLPARALRRRAP